MKKNRSKIFFLELILRFFTAIIYFITISIFFIISLILKTLSLFSSKEIKIKKSEEMIDGVSFIIPTWNKKEMVVNCVQLLDKYLSIEYPKIPKEIIIIENGSTDGSVEALSNLKTKIPIVLLKQKTNIGFAKAINLGLQNSKYNYVYLINNDMEPQKNFFNSIIDLSLNILKQNKKFFGISSQIFFFDKNKRREESGKTYSLPSLGYITIAHYVQEESLKDVSFTLYPGGGSSLINKHYFQKIGGYDYKSYTPLYCEDLDAGFIAWKFGLPSYFDPNSHVVHHHRSSSVKLTEDPSYFMYKNWLVFILKNFDSTNIINNICLYPLRIFFRKSDFKYSTQTLKNIL
ncbi:MAG: glycosyltransferase, partial [Candidatus Shapirobacteria bacterium]